MQYPSTCIILYGLEINILSCQYKYLTLANIWFGLRKRSKHNTTSLPTPPTRSVIRRQRYLHHLSGYAYLIEIRPTCPLLDSISNAQEIIVDVPLSNSTALTRGIIKNMAPDILRI